MIVVRRATIADAEAMSEVLIASITALCIADHQNRPEAVARWLGNKTVEGVRLWFGNPQNTLFVVERAGRMAATGGFNSAREIILNYVAPEHRFAGASSALLERMERDLGPGEARLTSTATAHGFYRARGWADDGPPEEFIGMTVYPMRKRLEGLSRSSG